MAGIEATSSYVLTLGLLTVFVLVWVTRQQKTKRDANVWLLSGVVGILLGAAGAMAGTYALGYQVKEAPPEAPAASAAPASPMMGGGGAPGAGAPGGGMGGGMGGMMGMMGGGGGQGPRPKQQLTTLIRKLELLTGDIVLTLTDEQRQALAKQVGEFAELKTLTDGEAEQKYKELLAVFDDAQKAKQDAIGLPRPSGGGGFGGGGAPPAPDANPFESEANANALKSLRERLTAK